MKTDVIRVSGHGKQLAAALEQADKAAACRQLSPRGALQLRLLTEEMMGLMRAITGVEEGQFWLEDENGQYQLHLLVQAHLGGERRERLLAAATSGKNEAATGLLGRLREFFSYTGDDDAPIFFNPFLFDGDSSMYRGTDWSLNEYRAELAAQRAQHRATPDAEEAWDELEKSVLAHVADEVKVSIRGTKVELIVFKKLE